VGTVELETASPPDLPTPGSSWKLALVQIEFDKKIVRCTVRSSAFRRPDAKELKMTSISAEMTESLFEDEADEEVSENIASLPDLS